MVKTKKMMYQYEVEVSIRKGLGPEWVNKNFPVVFDDVEEGVSELEVKEWAKREVNSLLYNSDDYRHYGKNWIIVDIHTV
jgi:hypothetical protein